MWHAHIQELYIAQEKTDPTVGGMVDWPAFEQYAYKKAIWSSPSSGARGKRWLVIERLSIGGTIHTPIISLNHVTYFVPHQGVFTQEERDTDSFQKSVNVKVILSSSGLAF